MDSINMEAQTLDDILPKSLKNLLMTTLQDNVILNYRLFAGDHTVISIKFESPMLNATAAADAANRINSPIQCYRRKSPASVS